MFGRPFGWALGLVGVLLIGLALAGVAYLAFNAGVSEGVAQAAELPASELERAAPLYYPPYAYRPFGWGFGLLGCLVPLLILFLLFGGMRLLFAPWRWRRGWRWGPWHGGGGGWGPKDPERWQRFREQAERWHQEMHEADQAADESQA